MTADPVAVIAGAGEGLGLGIARQFAKAGLTVVLAARNEQRLGRMADEIARAGGRALALPADIRDEAAVAGLFRTVEAEVGATEVVVYNAGAQYRNALLETPADLFEKVWRLSCYGGFLIGQAAARVMLPRSRGTILFTGATASVRGGAGFAAFAAAKFGLRALAQSMARELGPQGLHVAHVVIDGLIDTAAIRARFPEAVARLPPDGLLSPEEIGQAYLALHLQHRSAWTFELDLRPSAEPF